MLCQNLASGDHLGVLGVNLLLLDFNRGLLMHLFVLLLTLDGFFLLTKAFDHEVVLRALLLDLELPLRLHLPAIFSPAAYSIVFAW